MNSIEQLIGLLDRFKLTFYHFTDERNLASIRAHGLLSMRELRERGIVPVAGGNQWSFDADLRAGMDAYVHLCFLRQHPMEWSARQDGRIERSRFLRVAPEVLTLPGVMITDYDCFTDIEFNHERSINCQARSVALFCALYHTDQLATALASPENFQQLYRGRISEPGPTPENSLLL